MTFSRSGLKSILGAALAALVVTGCTTTTDSSSVTDASSFGFAGPSEAASVFRQTCLASLPSFSNFVTRAEAAGLERVGRRIGLREAHIVSGKKIVVGVRNPGAVEICGFSVDSNGAGTSVGAAILAAARSATGGGASRTYQTSLDYAVRLSNGSLLLHDLRRSSRQDRSIFVLTKPISENQVSRLIPN